MASAAIRIPRSQLESLGWTPGIASRILRVVGLKPTRYNENMELIRSLIRPSTTDGRDQSVIPGCSCHQCHQASASVASFLPAYGPEGSPGYWTPIPGRVCTRESFDPTASSSTYSSGRIRARSTSSLAARGSQSGWTRRRFWQPSPHRISMPTLPTEQSTRSFAASFSTRPSALPCSAPPRDMVRSSSTASVAGRRDGSAVGHGRPSPALRQKTKR